MVKHNIHRAQVAVAKLIKKRGVRYLRRRLGPDRHRLNKIVRKVLKHYHLTGTSVEQYYRLQFSVALLGVEHVWLPQR